ncbi:MAG: FecR domain-containing protein [Burkholderiaceae bacterium]
MPADPAMPSFDSLRQAADWFARLRASPDDAGWRQWLEQSPDHRLAWRQVEQVAQRFAPLRAGGDPGAATQALHVRRTPAAASRRATLKNLAGLAGAGVLGGLAYHDAMVGGWARGWLADHRTGTGQIRQWALDDGSQLWLNTASAVNVDFSAGLRRLDLLHGEILIDGVADARRPLVVDTRYGRLRAIDRPNAPHTRFSVRVLSSRAAVAVSQGSVDVGPARGRGSRVIDAGSQTSFTDERVGPSLPMPRGREAWTRGVLLAEDITLRELVAELSRYRSGHIALAPEVAGLRVLGGYPLHDPDKVLDMLARALPIRVSRPLPWWTSIDKA